MHVNPRGRQKYVLLLITTTRVHVRSSVIVNASARVRLAPCAAGIIVVTMVLVICLSFSGYLVNNIPVYFKWIGKLSYFSYAYAALVRYL